MVVIFVSIMRGNGRCLTTPYDSAGSREIPNNNNNKFTLRWIKSSKFFTIVILWLLIIKYLLYFFVVSIMHLLILVWICFAFLVLYFAENYTSYSTLNCLAPNWLSNFFPTWILKICRCGNNLFCNGQNLTSKYFQ